MSLHKYFTPQAPRLRYIAFCASVRPMFGDEHWSPENRWVAAMLRADAATSDADLAEAVRCAERWDDLHAWTRPCGQGGFTGIMLGEFWARNGHYTNTTLGAAMLAHANAHSEVFPFTGEIHHLTD